MAARDIQRWADEASGVEDWLRDVLRDAAHETPSAAQLDKLVAAVDTALRTPSSPSPSPSFWIAAGCASALLLAAGAWLLHGHDQSIPQPPAAAPTLHPTPEPEPESVTVAAPAPPAPPVAPPPAASPPKHTQRVRSAPAPLATPVPAADPALEVLLLRDAKRALVPAPERARELLLEHQHKYPQGAFVEEREALMVELLLRQGDTRQATLRAAEFRKRFQGSAYQRRLDDLLRTEVR